MLAIFDDGANRLAPKVIRLYSALIAVNLLVWVWAFVAFHSYPLLLATALIAYGFGLRHAVDADHIAAIGDKFGLEGGLWVMADATGAHSGTLGYIVIAIFVATWLVSFVWSTGRRGSSLLCGLPGDGLSHDPYSRHS